MLSIASFSHSFLPLLPLLFRRMFPTLRVSFINVDPHKRYAVLLDIVPVDNKRLVKFITTVLERERKEERAKSNITIDQSTGQPVVLSPHFPLIANYKFVKHP